MPKKRPAKPKSQHDKFVALARESGADESESAFVSKLRRLTGKKNPEKPKSGKR